MILGPLRLAVSDIGFMISQANALDSEAATWHLLWHLYGVPDAAFPGGLGGQALDGVGGRRSAAQRIADIIAENETLNRFVSFPAVLKHTSTPAVCDA